MFSLFNIYIWTGYLVVGQGNREAHVDNVTFVDVEFCGVIECPGGDTRTVNSERKLYGLGEPHRLWLLRLKQ